MWSPLKALLAKSNLLNQTMGDIVFETPEVSGGIKGSFFQWRVKKSLDGRQFLLNLRMKPDSYAGAEGSPTNYMNFDAAASREIQNNLELCISECARLNAAGVRQT